MALPEGAQEKFQFPSENSPASFTATFPSTSLTAGAISDLIAPPPSTGTVQTLGSEAIFHAQIDSLLPSGCHTAEAGPVCNVRRIQPALRAGACHQAALHRTCCQRSA